MRPTPQRLRLPGGRMLGWATYGDPSGRPIAFFHGFPGSHEQAAIVHPIAQRLGVALLAFDRPGFGDSMPQPGATMTDVAHDLAALLDHLGLARLAAIGVSCGGPHALVAAQVLGTRLSAVGLLAGIGPMDQPALRAGQLPPLRLLFALARWRRGGPRPLLALDALGLRRAPQRALKALAGLLAEPDRAALAHDPALGPAFALSLARAYAQGLDGALDEARRIALLRGADLVGTTQPVQVFQSGHDRHVPPAMGDWLAAQLPNARLHPRPGEGHLSIVTAAFADCVAALPIS